MEIGWGNCNQEKKGFGQTERYVGGGNCVGERKYKGTWSLFRAQTSSMQYSSIKYGIYSDSPPPPVRYALPSYRARVIT